MRKNCGNLKLVHIFPAQGHQFTQYEEVLPSTCTKPNYLVYSCVNEDKNKHKVCGEKEYRPIGSSLGHSYQFSYSSRITDGVKGYDVYRCTRCGIEQKRKLSVETVNAKVSSNNASAEAASYKLVYHLSKGASQYCVEKVSYDGDYFLKDPKELAFKKDKAFFAGWMIKRRDTNQWCVVNAAGKTVWGSYSQSKMKLFNSDSTIARLAVEKVDNMILDAYGMWIENNYLDVSNPYFGVAPLGNDSYQKDDSYDIHTRNALQKVMNKAAECSKENGNRQVVVFIPKGIYEINTTVFIPSNITLKFEAGAILQRGKHFLNNNTMFQIGDKLIQKDSEGRYLLSVDNVAGGYAQAKNVSIIGGTFDADSNGILNDGAIIRVHHSDNITISNCNFRNYSGKHALVFVAARNITVSGCNFTMSSQIAAKFLDVIQNNPMSEGNGEAIHIDDANKLDRAYPFDQTISDNILITGNTFNHCLSGVGNHTYWETSGSQVTISENHFNDIKFYCISLYSKDLVELIDNVVERGNSEYYHYIRMGKETITSLNGNDDVNDVWLMSTDYKERDIKGVAGEILESYMKQ